MGQAVSVPRASHVPGSGVFREWVARRFTLFFLLMYFVMLKVKLNKVYSDSNPSPLKLNSIHATLSTDGSARDSASGEGRGGLSVLGFVRRVKSYRVGSRAPTADDHWYTVESHGPFYRQHDDVLIRRCRA